MFNINGNTYDTLKDFGAFVSKLGSDSASCGYEMA